MMRAFWPEHILLRSTATMGWSVAFGAWRLPRATHSDR